VRNKLLVGALVVVVAVGAILWWKRGGHSETAATNGEGSATAHVRGPRPPAAPATVSGHVARRGGGPIAGATVALAQASFGSKLGGGHDQPPLIATTDASGAWSTAKVPPGDYTITAAAPGFLPGTQPKLAIAPGESKAGIDFQLDAGGTSVHGTVSDVGGGPIGGARVSARPENLRAIADDSTPIVTLAGPDGHYELTLPDGPVVLTASHDDYTSVAHDAEVAGKPLTVDFALVPGGTITGQVVARDTGKPVPGALIDARAPRRRFEANHEALADGDGKFTLRSLPSGAIALEASGYGYASSSPTTVEVGIGEQIDGVRVLVDHALSISGRVVDKASHQGLPGAHVAAWTMATQSKAEAPDPTDKDGAFEIVGVKPGSYLLLVMAEDKMPDLGKTVEVTDKDVTGVVVEVSTGATLQGRVDPSAVASIELQPAGEIGIANVMEMIKTTFVHADSDSTGAFVMRHVPEGSFVLVARAKDGPTGRLPVTVTGANQTGLVITLEQRGSISGRVIDTNGAPVAGTKVMARPTEKASGVSVMVDGLSHGSATTAVDGTFKIIGLDAGKYHVEAWDLDELMTRMMIKGKDKKEPETIDVVAGSEHGGVTITVEAHDGVIRGTVLGSDGSATADAWVTAYPAPPEGMPAKYVEYASYNALPPVLSGADGKFTIEKLRKGKYHLVAEGPRGASHGEQDGKAGDTVTIQLASLGTLSGHATMRAAPVTSYDLSCRSPAAAIDRHIDAADGAYSLEHLAPGPYQCNVSADAGTASGKVDVPAGAATLDLQVVPWASLTGTIVSVLDGRPIAGVAAIALDSNDTGRSMMSAVLGSPPTSDATGRFTIDHVAAGSGSLMVMAKTGSMQPLATKPYTATQGQQVDLGTIKIVPPRSGDAGTLGMATDVEDSDLAVTMVQPGGPAANAGIVVGDKITQIQGTSVTDVTPKVAQQLISSGTIAAGQTISLTLARGSTVSVTAVKW
jgi:protocatechuate 3,4-dioxygenase beta subunit